MNIQKEIEKTDNDLKEWRNSTHVRDFTLYNGRMYYSIYHALPPSVFEILRENMIEFLERKKKDLESRPRI